MGLLILFSSKSCEKLYKLTCLRCSQQYTAHIEYYIKLPMIVNINNIGACMRTCPSTQASLTTQLLEKLHTQLVQNARFPAC